MNQWKWLAFGIGVLVGAVGASVVSSRPNVLKDGATTILSHGLAAKRKISAAVETTKENFDDLVAEAQQKEQDRTESKA